MCALDGFHVEVKCSRVGVRANSGISRVCKRARLAVAETGDIVFIATEVLLFCGPGEVRFGGAKPRLRSL